MISGSPATRVLVLFISGLPSPSRPILWIGRDASMGLWSHELTWAIAFDILDRSRLTGVAWLDVQRERAQRPRRAGHIQRRPDVAVPADVPRSFPGRDRP